MLDTLRTLFDALESGVLLVGPDRRVVLANQAMGALLDRAPPELVGLSTQAVAAHVRELADGGPPLVADGRLLDGDVDVVCEEFELKRPERSVVRWVARRIDAPGIVQMATVTDITAEVDLQAAHERLAHTDRLTGLLNRHGIEVVLKRELARQRRSRAPLSVVLCDVDHFKRVNDVHGHGAGDLVLKQIGKCLGKTIRGSDAAARWGGEEFLVVLAEADREGARVFAERLRAAVERLELPCGRVTLSAGIAQLADDESAGDVIARADACLYRAKGAGRNRVC